VIGIAGVECPSGSWGSEASQCCHDGVRSGSGRNGGCRGACGVAQNRRAEAASGCKWRGVGFPMPSGFPHISWTRDMGVGWSRHILGS